jgi:hypothetical protein
MTPARSRFSSEQLIFVAAALVLVIGIQLPVAHYMSPKSGLGYAIGIVGGVLILMQLMYAVRKRVRSLRFMGSVPRWFQTHMMLGIIGPVCILLHCGFSLGATNSNIALFSMLTVAGSGIFGRYFYSKIHHGLYGRKATLNELQERANELRERGTKILMMPELVVRVEDEERRLLAVADWPAPAMLVAPIFISMRSTSSRARLKRYVRAAIRVTAARHKAVAKQSERFERVAFEYVSRRMKVTREVVEFRVYERLFSVWHVLHMPLFLMLIAAGIVHVISVHVY